MAELTEEQVIRALKRLSRGWPSHLWLFSASGTLHLMRNDADGNRVVVKAGGIDGVDPACIVEDDFHGIENDGGDW